MLGYYSICALIAPSVPGKLWVISGFGGDGKEIWLQRQAGKSRLLFVSRDLHIHLKGLACPDFAGRKLEFCVKGHIMGCECRMRWETSVSAGRNAAANTLAEEIK